MKKTFSSVVINNNFSDSFDQTCFLPKIFFLVLARDENHVKEKIRELEILSVRYLIICGSPLNHPNILYRKPKGKYDAINFGSQFIPLDTEIVVLNDVDTQIHNFQAALQHFRNNKTALVFARVSVNEGPQALFYTILDFIRRKIPVAASGELMLIQNNFFKKILPIKPCKAEDSYILFKVLESKNKVFFCKECYVKTERTKTAEKEELYKRKTVAGLYQALAYSKPSYSIRVFYFLLPFASPFLLVLGKRGYFWMKGILLGLSDYLRGDKSGQWQTAYMN